MPLNCCMYACKQTNKQTTVITLKKCNSKQRKNKSKKTSSKQKQTSKLPLNWPKQPHKDYVIERCRMPFKCCMYACKQTNKQTTVMTLEKMQQQARTKVIQHDMCSQPQWVATTLVHLNEKEEIQILLSTPGVRNINLNLFLHDISDDISAGHVVMTYRMTYQHGMLHDISDDISATPSHANVIVGSTRKIMNSF